MNGDSASTARKKLVPVLSREAKCQHEYDDDDELSLHVDCNECQGAQDLANKRCLTGVLQILSSEAKPDTLILRRHIHRRYREPCLSVLMGMASELAAVNRALSMKSVPSDRRCLTCEASIPNLLGRIRRELLEDPRSFFETRAEVLDGIRDDLAAIDCSRLGVCVARAYSSWRTREG